MNSPHWKALGVTLAFVLFVAMLCVIVVKWPIATALVIGGALFSAVLVFIYLACLSAFR